MRMLPPRLRCLNTLSPVGGAVWVGIGGVTLPEEVYHWSVGGRAFEVSKALH